MNEGEKNPKFEVIGPFSGDYERNKIEVPDFKEYLPSGNVFGVTEITTLANELKGLDERSPIPHHELAFISLPENLNRPEVQGVVQHLKAQFLERVKDPKYRPAGVNFFAQGFRNPDIRHRLASVAKASEIPEHRDIDVRTIPDDLFLDLVVNHASSEGAKLLSLREREPTYRRLFLKRAQELIAQGVFGADFSAVVNRVNEMTVLMRDVLQQDVAELLGEVDYPHSIIHLASYISRNQESPVYTHEMLHAISGRTIVLSSIQNTEIVEPGLVKRTGRLDHFRSGFVQAAENGIRADMKWFWLNEGTTQDLTEEFLPEQKAEFYKQERGLIAQLRKRGRKILPKKLFYDAYFEDTPEGRPNDRPKWNQLNAAVDQAYGNPDFLRRLDDYVKKYGLEQAISVMKNNSDRI